MLSAVSGAVDVLAGLEPAERCGLLKVGDGRIEWRHPLARAATYAAATADERSRAHRALAALPTQAPDRRAWHLVPCRRGSRRGRRRGAGGRRRARPGSWGGYAEACRAMQRSAELTPDPEARAAEARRHGPAGRRSPASSRGSRSSGPRSTS